MIEEMRLLIQLQAVDKIMYDLEKDKADIPNRLEQIEQELAIVRQEGDLVQAELNTVVERRKDLESTAEEIRGRIKKAEHRLMGSKSTKEFQAATAETEEGKDRLKQTEDLVVETMEAQEGLEKRAAKIMANTATIESGAKKEKEELAARLVRADKELAGLAAKRKELASKVEPGLLKEYDFIRQRRAGVAVAPVSEGSCGVCRMRLPPQQFNELQRMDQMMSCPSCRRMMYWVDGEPFAEFK